MHATTCKFCQRPISVEIDESYAGLGDPFKILPLACCNRCADLRVERRWLEERLARCCSLAAMTPASDAKKREMLRALLERLSKRYARMIAKWHCMDVEFWDGAIVDQLIDYPERWGQTIGQLWRQFRQWKKQQQQVQPQLIP